MTGVVIISATAVSLDDRDRSADFAGVVTFGQNADHLSVGDDGSAPIDFSAMMRIA